MGRLNRLGGMFREISWELADGGVLLGGAVCTGFGAALLIADDLGRGASLITVAVMCLGMWVRLAATGLMHDR